MKKILFAIIFLSSISLNAQLFQGGVELGIIGSQIDIDGYGGYHKLGPSFLTFTTVQLTETSSITSGVGYAIKGANTRDANFGIHYAEIPFLLNIAPKNFKNITFSFGLVYGYLITANIDFGSYLISDLRKSEFSYQASLNYKLGDKLTAKFGSNYSLIPITKDSPVFCFSCMHNNNIRLTFQYKIFWSNKNN